MPPARPGKILWLIYDNSRILSIVAPVRRTSRAGHKGRTRIPKASHSGPSRAIGRVLRSLREERGLTLRGVEQVSRRFPEPIAFDYLARLERGALMPSVPKLATLANVYQRPLHEFVDLYELEHLRALVPEQKGDFWHFRKLGIDYRAAGDHRRAAAAMLRGLDAARASGDIDAIAQALTSVGIGLSRLTRYNAARRFYEDALRVIRVDRILGYALHGLAQAHYHLDDLILSELLCEKAEAFVAGDPSLVIHLRSLQAAIAHDREQYEEAVRLGREAMSGYSSLGDRENAVLAGYSLGNNLVKAQQVEEGLAMLRESMSLAAELGDPMLRADSAIAYGRTLYALGRSEDAISPLKSAFLIARDREMPRQAFHSAFYLWKLSDERGFESGGDWLELARLYRPEVEQRSEEIGEFDFQYGRRGII